MNEDKFRCLYDFNMWLTAAGSIQRVLQYRPYYIQTTYFKCTTSFKLNKFTFSFLFNCVCYASLGINSDNTDIN
jgi:hypothetical protein